MLESLCHKDNAFITLTYSDENIPEGGTLVPRHLTLFLKRIRNHMAENFDRKVRYYAVGEYGDRYQRPHYHLALFNYPVCAHGRTNHARIARSGNCCHSCDLVASYWKLGGCDIGSLESSSAAYISGYVTKKMTRKEDERLNGRYPEFARMSLKPGIGAGFIPEVASVLLQLGLEDMADVPSSLRHGGSVLPLGRYLRRKLREHVGRDPKAPQATLDAIQEEMRPVFEEARKVKTQTETLDQAVWRVMDELNMGERLRMAYRQKSHDRKRLSL